MNKLLSVKHNKTIGNEEIAVQAEFLAALQVLPPHVGISVCLSYLLYHSEVHHEQFRRVINEPVIRQGFTGESMIANLTRAARG